MALSVRGLYHAGAMNQCDLPTRLRSGCNPRCRGCAHRALEAAASERQKMGWLQRQLHPWAEVIEPVRAVSGQARWGYRDRVSLSTAWGGPGWQYGLHARDELIPIPHCPIHSPRVRAAVRLLGAALPPGPRFPMAFHVQSGAQVTLVLKGASLPSTAWVTEALTDELAAAGVEGLWLNLFPSAGRRLFHKRGWHLLWGRERSRDARGLLYGPAAFQQLLPGLYHQALDEAAVFLAPAAGDAVVDLYCGNGSTLARWTAAGAAALGVEWSGDAVECASINAPAAAVLRGTCETRLPQVEAWLRGRAGRRLLYVNPPRTGLEPQVLRWTTERLRPERMAYLSCSAGTLRRDLQALVESGFSVERIVPYDFFPQTYHVETLVLLRAA